MFDGISTINTDVLLKYTYFGDANLDGKVDGSDYTRIDAAFIAPATGWYNGDFNYDGVINGSDYTLIDNAFNDQGARITAEIVVPASTASRLFELATIDDKTTTLPSRARFSDLTIELTPVNRAKASAMNVPLIISSDLFKFRNRYWKHKVQRSWNF